VPEPLILDPARAEASGFVALGGDLNPSTLLRAYRSGIFPWYGADLPICWWSPDPRAILPLENLHISRRLARTQRAKRFTSTIDRDFARVIRGCTENRADGTWLLPEMIEAYERLHKLGQAHSVEVWRGGDLAGGVYGVSLGGFFAAESMFHRHTDASKVALVALVEHLTERGHTLLDIQLLTPHTARMGGIEISRAEYLKRLEKALAQPTTF
jgi:leucyl/phenylalanyl-tRNA---protein transferase